MVDSIDLDEIETDDSEAEDDATYGDWLWRGEGDPDDEPDPPWEVSTAIETDETPAEPVDPGTDEGIGSTENTETTEPTDGEDSIESTDSPESIESTDDSRSDESADQDESGESDRQPTPGVPRTSKGPVGVPTEKGGAGGGSSSQAAGGQSATPDSDAAESAGEASPNAQRTTNHGDDPTPDEMTMAITYEALNRLADPRFAIADARSWTDWIGIVGTVSTPAIKKLQRDTGIEVDFFGGSETGPAQRLADVTPKSMFYADRMVLVGVSDNESIAEAADWEFVPLEKAAEKAGWEIEHAE